MTVQELIEKLKEYHPDMTAKVEHAVLNEYEEEIYLAIKNDAGDIVDQIYLY